MKILVISNYRSTHTVRPEAEIFIGLKKRGVDISIMTYADSAYAKKFKEHNIRVIDFHPEKKKDKAEIDIIRKELITQKHQVLHLFNSAAIVNGLAAAKNLNVKVVLYRGYTGNIHWYDPFSYRKYLHPRVDKIFCNSQSVKDHIDQNSLFSRGKTIRINKGHSLEWYQHIQKKDKKELGFKQNDFVLSITANNRRMKGMKFLLKAFDNIDSNLPVHLLILGRGMDTKENLKIIEKSPNKEKINLMGFRNDVLEIVAGSDVFVLSSIKGESITKSVIEAMCLGTTPLITDIPGNKELHIEGAGKLVVPAKNPKALADAIVYLYEHQDLCKKWGQMAREHIDKNLNHEKTVQETFELYQSLISS
jgi:glycosyltransferase involved in cell wall biosynthesis